MLKFMLLRSVFEYWMRNRPRPLIPLPWDQVRVTFYPNNTNALSGTCITIFLLAILVPVSASRHKISWQNACIFFMGKGHERTIMDHSELNVELEESRTRRKLLTRSHSDDIFRESHVMRSKRSNEWLCPSIAIRWGSSCDFLKFHFISHESFFLFIGIRRVSSIMLFHA